MHPVNKVLSLFGLQLSKVSQNKQQNKQIDSKEKVFREKYDHCYKLAENNKRGFKTIKAYRYSVGEHPISLQDLEFEFVAYHI